MSITRRSAEVRIADGASHEGRLYVVDTVDATEYAMDLTREQRRLRALARFYQYDQ